MKVETILSNKDCISNTRKRTDYVPGLTPTQRRAAEEYQKTQAQAGTSGRDKGRKGKPATKFRPKSAITDELTAKMGAAVQVKCTSTKHQRPNKQKKQSNDVSNLWGPIAN